jgi:hypothetical protein
VSSVKSDKAGGQPSGGLLLETLHFTPATRPKAGCTNKANSGGRDTPPFHCSIIPPFCAKQTQFGPEPFQGQVLCRQGLALPRTRGEPPQNKANLPKRGTEAVSRLRIEPYRVACLGPAAAGLRGLVVQTNPISATVPIRRSALPGGQIVRNKPNFRRSHGRGKCPAEKELWRVVQATGFGKTKPNLGRMGYLGDGTWGSLLCKTNPILRLRIPDWGQTCRLRPRQAKRAKQTQTCASWGIWETARRRPVVRNEPNFRPRRVGRGPGDEGRGCDCAKRTQFPGAAGRGQAPRAWAVGQMRKTNPICRSPGEHNVQNEANLPPAALEPRDRSHETKPIVPRKVSGEDAQPIRCRSGHALRRAEGRSCKTNPIRAGPSGAVPVCTNKANPGGDTLGGGIGQ